MSKTRTQKFIYNSASTALYQIVVMLSGFVIPRVILKYYGSEMNGLINSITQFITYFNLVESGISGAGVFALYKPLADKNYEKISGIVSAVKKYYIQAGIIFTFFVILLAVIYPSFVYVEKMSHVLIGMLAAVLGAKGFMEFFTLAKYRVLLTADQKTYVISLTSAVYLILNTVMVVLFSIKGLNIVLVYFLASGALLFRTIFLHIYIKIRYKEIDFKSKSDIKSLDKRWPALFLQLLNSIQNGVPIIIATVLTNLKEVSVYSIYNMFMLGITGILSIFTGSLSSAFGEVIASKEQSTLQRAYRDFEFIFFAMITVIYSVSFVVLVPLVKIYTNGIEDINYDVPITGFLFVLNGLLYNMKTPQGMMVISAGLYKETMVQSSIQGGIIVIAGSILGYFFGLNGILIGACLSNLYRTIEIMYFIPKHVTKIPVRETFFRYIRMIGAVCVIYLPFLYFKPEAGSIKELIILFLISFVYAAAVVIILSIILEYKQIRMIKNRFKYILARKSDKNPSA